MNPISYHSIPSYYGIPGVSAFVSKALIVKEITILGGGGKLENLWEKKKKPKSTFLANNTEATKQTKPRPAASAAPHPITPSHFLLPTSYLN